MDEILHEHYAWSQDTIHKISWHLIGLCSCNLHLHGFCFFWVTRYLTRWPAWEHRIYQPILIDTDTCILHVEHKSIVAFFVIMIEACEIEDVLTTDSKCKSRYYWSSYNHESQSRYNSLSISWGLYRELYRIVEHNNW